MVETNIRPTRSELEGMAQGNRRILRWLEGLVSQGGATGTFTTTDGKTVTVTNGIITEIV
tara:strand:- start:439 stop:618 length:180 start_codon:yes stop_codon:yes gene_type:complete